jgi:hypothetical protein
MTCARRIGSEHMAGCKHCVLACSSIACAVVRDARRSRVQLTGLPGAHDVLPSCWAGLRWLTLVHTARGQVQSYMR